MIRVSNSYILECFRLYAGKYSYWKEKYVRLREWSEFRSNMPVLADFPPNSTLTGPPSGFRISYRHSVNAQATAIRLLAGKAIRCPSRIPGIAPGGRPAHGEGSTQDTSACL